MKSCERVGGEGSMTWEANGGEFGKSGSVSCVGM